MILDQRLEISKLVNKDVCIIILDACRYDYFEMLYSNFFDGNLMPARSPASCTLWWLKSCFPYFYDITYYSANPHVNSVKSIYNYFGRDHFKEIVDVWRFGWSRELGTVPPKNVNTAYIDRPPRCNTVIIHYVQPHFPPCFKINIKLPEKKDPLDVKWIDVFLSELVKKGRMTLKEYRGLYKENLIHVLRAVADLIPFIRNSRIIITSDHGEFLGENNCFLHPCHRSDHVLRVVPWFIVK